MVKHDFLTPEMLRIDGRRPGEVRPLEFQSGDLVLGADGSASVSMGMTKAIAYVYGPKASSRRSQNSTEAEVLVEFRTATFGGVDRRKRSKGDRQSQEKSLWLQKLFQEVILVDQFPRSQIEIFVEVLTQDGSPVSAAINAVTVALANAGIPMRDIVSSVTIGLIDSTTVLVDLNQSESEHGSGSGQICLATYARTGGILLLQVESKVQVPAFMEALKTGIASCAQVSKAVRDHLVESSESRIVS